MEYRAFRAESVTEDDQGTLSGLVAPYRVRTQIGDPKRGGFKEEIASGTFTKSVRERDIVMLDNHDHHRPIARKSAGTLSFEDTANGLRCKADPPDTTYANDLRANIRAGNYGGMSFGFECIKDEWFDEQGKPSNRFDGTVRVLREVKLIEVSPVTFPAYPSTSIQARDALLAEREQRAMGKKAKKKGSPKPYGNVAYADPKNGKYPINTLDHVKAAWSYINMPKNASKYPLNGVSLASVKARIKAAAKKYGIKIKAREDELALEWRSLAEKYDENARPEDRIKNGTKKRIPQIITELNAAVSAFANAKDIPPELQDAVNLVASANTHVKHIRDTEKIPAMYFDKKDKKKRAQEPDSSTPGKKKGDKALSDEERVRLHEFMKAAVEAR